MFTPVKRHASNFPKGETKSEKKEITIWCSNDYLGMGQHPKVLSTLKNVAYEVGVGSGGTRNIAGNTYHHIMLEEELADLH